MTYATEFPALAGTAMPAVVLGDGWTDSSWRNDACPMFIHEASGVAVWVNLDPEVAASEDNPGAPYMAVALEWEGRNGWQHGHGGDVELFETDSADVLMRSLPHFSQPRALAHKFALILRETATDEEWTAMLAANIANAETLVCASHDFCDANMAMHEAFVAVFGRDPLPADGPMSDEDLRLWSIAWSIAKAERLTGASV